MATAKKKLVLVESPGKIKKISHILGTGYTVLATAGHIMEIDSVGAYNTGIDVKNGFAISYVLDKTKKDLVKKIRDAAKTASEIYICSDGDREGEKIADELRDLLKAHKSKLKRAVFNEISDKAVKNAIANPIPFDENMIQAAESRAALDRLVGYRLSPLALSKVNCESAGRVQSALLYLAAKKEREIQAFTPTKYWEVYLDFKKGAKLLTAKLSAIGKKKVDRLTDIKDVNDVLTNCIPENYTVSSITEKEKELEPRLPLTTSAMLQVGSSYLGFNPERTRRLSQELYESGMITYIRTDSVRFSDEFIESTKAYIEKNYSGLYRGLNIPADKNADAQDAHEAIRPVDITKTPAKSGLEGDQLKLYKLIYNISLCAFFKPAKVLITTMEISNGQYVFEIQGKQLTFASFLEVFNEEDDDSKILPAFKKGERIVDKDLYMEEKQTQPPQRYSEAGLIKLMEKTGIGRPSSYTPTVETLKKREYITIEKKAVVVTEKGLRLDAMLQGYFQDIINDHYTSEMEKNLDLVSGGSKTKTELLEAFWSQFEPLVLKAAREINKDKPKPKDAGKPCPKCGKPLVIRTSRTGTEFIACSGFPKCKYTESLDKPQDGKDVIQCPTCGDGHMVKRKSKKGSIFWGCSRWPKCSQTFNEEEMKEYLAKLADKHYDPKTDDKQ